MVDTTKNKIDFSKCSILTIPKQDVLFLLQSFSKYSHISLINRIEVQEGYKILDVHFDYRTQSFDFIIWHELFLPVERGAEYPKAHPDFVMVCTQYELRKVHND